MNRRRFLASLLAAAPALMLDPERLLWEPGKKAFSLPAVQVFGDVHVHDGMAGMAIRFQREWNHVSSRVVNRVDVFYGGAVLHPDLIRRVDSNDGPVFMMHHRDSQAFEQILRGRGPEGPIAFHPDSFAMASRGLK